MGAVWKQLRRKSRFKKLYNINLRGSTEFDCFNLLVSHHHFDDDDGFGPRNRSIQSARGNGSRSGDHIQGETGHGLVGDHIEGVSHFSFPEIVCWHQRLICCKRSRRLIWSFEWANLGLFLFIFVLFATTNLQKNWRPQWDSKSDRRSRMQPRWPLDHHHHGLIRSLVCFYIVILLL